MNSRECMFEKIYNKIIEYQKINNIKKMCITNVLYYREF